MITNEELSARAAETTQALKKLRVDADLRWTIVQDLAGSAEPRASLLDALRAGNLALWRDAIGHAGDGRYPQAWSLMRQAARLAAEGGDAGPEEQAVAILAARQA